jgi:putative addiction module component (TIGR02574 family)
MPRLTEDFDFSQLSIDERTFLAHRLRESVQREAETMPLTAAQLAEIEQRIADADAGLIPSSPWTDVKLRLKNRG